MFVMIVLYICDPKMGKVATFFFSQNFKVILAFLTVRPLNITFCNVFCYLQSAIC